MKQNSGISSFAQLSKLLVGTVVLGLVAGKAAKWISQRGSNLNGEGTPQGGFTFGGLKDKVNQTTQKIRDTRPSAEQQMVDVENELQPGG